MAVTPYGDDRGWPVRADTADQTADMGTDFVALGCLTLTQDRDHAMTGRRVIYMDRQKASLVVMSVEPRHLLMPVHRIGGVVDVEHDAIRWVRVALAPEIHHSA